MPEEANHHHVQVAPLRSQPSGRRFALEIHLAGFGVCGHVVFLYQLRRMRGSTAAASRSASKLPTTTSDAVTTTMAIKMG